MDGRGQTDVRGGLSTQASFPRSCDAAAVDSHARELSGTDNSRRADTAIAMIARSRVTATNKTGQNPRNCLKCHMGDTSDPSSGRSLKPLKEWHRRSLFWTKPHSHSNLPIFSKRPGICHNHHGQAALLPLSTLLTWLLLCPLEHSTENSLNFWL